MEVVTIRESIDSYAPDQCGETMTVGELIAELQFFDEDAPVFLRSSNKYEVQWGAIKDWQVQVEYTDEEEDD